MLEIFHPDLYKSIDEANAWGAFDSERMFYGEAITEYEGRLIVAD